MQRLTRKPGTSAAVTTYLPIASPSARAVRSARSPEAAPATTSTSLITGAGLKKCIPTTRSGPGTPAAISVTESDEVLVASTQAGSTAAATEPSSSSFSSNRSGAASITSSAGPSCPRSATGSMRPRAASASDRPILPFSTWRSSAASAARRPRSSASATGS